MEGLIVLMHVDMTCTPVNSFVVILCRGSVSLLCLLALTSGASLNGDQAFVAPFLSFSLAKIGLSASSVTTSLGKIHFDLAIEDCS